MSTQLAGTSAAVTAEEAAAGLAAAKHELAEGRGAGYEVGFGYVKNFGSPHGLDEDEDRRKGAARTNAIRRARRQAFEDEKFERAVAEMLAVDKARRARRRARYEREKAARRPPSHEEYVFDLAAARERNRARGRAYGPD